MDLRTPVWLCLSVFFASAMVWAAMSTAWAAQPYSRSSTPEARYESYRKSLEKGTDGQAAPTLYNRKDASPRGGSASTKIFNLKQILNSGGGGGAYGMQSLSATPPVPYGSRSKGPQPPPTSAQLQEMARQDRERTVQQAVQESDARLARIQRMQADIYRQADMQTKAASTQPDGVSRKSNGSESPAARIQYTYRKTDPAQVQAPRRVFLSDR